MKPDKNKLEAVFQDVSRLFGKLHSSNSDNEILTAVRMVEKKLEAVGLHIGDLGNFLQAEDVKNLFAMLFATDEDILIDLARAGGKYFCTGDGVCFADIESNGHRQTLSLTSTPFDRWLRQQFYLAKKKAPKSSQLKSCIATLQADAQFGEGERKEVYLRVARRNDCVFLDLGDPEWRVIEVTPAGWGIILNPPVRFRRTPAMTALPLPQSGGSIELLRPFVNLNADNFVLFVCALADALIEGRPHPVIFLAGEEGASKSTLGKIARALVDPHKVRPKSLAGSVRDLFVEAENSYWLLYDNIGSISPRLSDGLCMVATGTGYATRRLYTDNDVTLLGGGARPVWLTGLRNVITRSDLADRSIILTLDYIPPNQRKTESEVEFEFERKRPLILGALLDITSHALGKLPYVRPKALPRMADFARHATACETAFTEAGSFERAYARSVREAVHCVVEEENSGVAISILAFMKSRTEPWRGSATDLLALLTTNDLTQEQVTKAGSWPRNHRTFSAALAEAVSALRKLGVVVTRAREGHSHRRVVELRLVTPQESRQADDADKQTSEENENVGTNTELTTVRWGEG
jgi:hypothetical protein